MYWHELIQELEIIHALDCFLAGVIVGMIVTLTVITLTEGRK